MVISVPVCRSPLKYVTVPLGVVIGPACLATVCLEETQVVRGLLANGKVDPGKKTRLLLQLLYRTARLYLECLQQLNKKAEELESALGRSMRNEEMFDLMEVQKSLVFLTTALGPTRS